ncbi:S8 family serine peptidase [Hymenobacter busanensis]|nr:S8 family serine peptidase [Hymenobacter busanensis]QHJ06403.1 S8 family serine peptidase [Hymenobacter busanensis]
MRFFSLVALLAGLSLATAEAAPRPPARPAGTVRRHLIYFRDKAGTPFTVGQPQAFLSARAIQRRQRQGIAVQPRDLPVSPSYVAQVKAVPGVQLWYTSRWFNAAVVACDSAALGQLRAKPFVVSAQTLNRNAKTPPRVEVVKEAAETQTTAQRTAHDKTYGQAFWQANMIGAVALHNAGFRGEGMHIAVLDAGFPGVNQTAPFASLRNENRLLSTFDFVDHDRGVYEKNSHGTNTLSCMGANQANVYIGTAPKASYHLLLTEDVFSEHPIEEANWLIAAEYADSAGVDIISSSLGYTTFDAPSRDHTYADMNGRTALASRAATVAARTGILVVNSAGNDGNNSWRYIGAPADADSVLTVGAVDSMGLRAAFSSVGPTSDGRIKPNLSAQGVIAAIVSPSGLVGRGNGTSFACPVLAGMAASFWQANPTLTAQQVLQFLQQSASQATAPNNLIGYGIPNAERANILAKTGTPTAGGQLSIFPNPTSRELYLSLPADLRNQPLHVVIHDVRGALIGEQLLAPSGAAQVPLRVPALRSGMYLCTVEPQGGGKTHTLRFLQY